MLPFIDLNPKDLTCIYSTLLHVIDLAFKRNIPTPSITFDQPLWVKAIEIVQTKKLKTIVRLESFHCLMSFIGMRMCMCKHIYVYGRFWFREAAYANVQWKEFCWPHDEWKSYIQGIERIISGRFSPLNDLIQYT